MMIDIMPEYDDKSETIKTFQAIFQSRIYVKKRHSLMGYLEFFECVVLNQRH